MEKCPICRSEVIDEKCSQTRKKTCPYVEFIETTKEIDNETPSS